MPDVLRPKPRIIRFGLFEVDLRSGDLRKAGARLTLQEQPLHILRKLLEHPGELVTREDLCRLLWPAETFVDFEHGLNAAVKRLRDTLGDSADTPRFIETLPKRGYRFIAPVTPILGDPGASGNDEPNLLDPARPRLNPIMPVESERVLDQPIQNERDSAVAPIAAPGKVPIRYRRMTAMVIGFGAFLLAVATYVAWSRRDRSVPVVPRGLSRLTFEAGLQADPAWSPDGRFVAYSSNQSGNFDIWVQPIGGGRPVQVTTNPAHDWQPAWSPDGNWLAFRSERDGGGIFVVPSLGGHERRLASIGSWPKWSADGSKLLVVTQSPLKSSGQVPEVYLLGVDGTPPSRILEKALTRFGRMGRITWHPDGRRISFWGLTGKEGGFWTLPLSGGASVMSEVADDVKRNQTEAGIEFGRFVWGPAGDAVYLEGFSNGVKNLWKVKVDPHTLRWVAGPERLTTGLGQDSDLAIAPDGHRLAFVTRTETTRVWSLPFNAETGQLTAGGDPVTATNMSVESFDMSADGKRLVFVATRPGKAWWELWSKSLEDGREVILGEAADYFAPRLSRDGTRVAYRDLDKTRPGPWRETRRLSWQAASGGEAHMLPQGLNNGWDWSSDGERLLHNCPLPVKFETLCTSPRGARTTAETRTVLVDPDQEIWQGRFSPDGRWICFTTTNVKDPGVAIIGVVPSSGGKWIPITDARLWADKPRWGPDGNVIYFISNRQSAFFNVWGIRFDSSRGLPIREEFQVTRLDDPGHLISATGNSEIALNDWRLMVPITEVSGSVWLIDNLKR